LTRLLLQHAESTGQEGVAVVGVLEAAMIRRRRLTRRSTEPPDLRSWYERQAHIIEDDLVTVRLAHFRMV